MTKAMSAGYGSEHDDFVFELCGTIKGLRGYLESGRDRLVPRVHGNGFIQLDLTPRVRMHVWGPDIPHQSVPTPIHDHTFGFQSRILTGSLVNIRYSAMPAQHFPSHTIYRARVRAGEDTILVPEPTKAILTPVEAMILSPSSNPIYWEEPGDIHQSVADCRALTVIRKDDLTMAQGGSSPRIFVPIGSEPDNSFRRDAYPADMLWNFIVEAL